MIAPYKGATNKHITKRGAIRVDSQAHVPTYILSWLVAVLNPLLYVLCNQAYRWLASYHHSIPWHTLG